MRSSQRQPSVVWLDKVLVMYICEVIIYVQEPIQKRMPKSSESPQVLRSQAKHKKKWYHHRLKRRLHLPPSPSLSLPPSLYSSGRVPPTYTAVDHLAHTAVVDGVPDSNPEVLLAWVSAALRRRPPSCSARLAGASGLGRSDRYGNRRLCLV